MMKASAKVESRPMPLRAKRRAASGGEGGKRGSSPANPAGGDDVKKLRGEPLYLQLRCLGA